ncbi:4Fe-4S binding protein, partial [bacterium]|nr:4Fe-4S binding protein [bacterium]
MKPQTVRWISFGVALIFALPLPLGIATGLYLWLSPYLFLHSVLAARHFVLFHALAVAVALAAVWKHRFFCHWVCPTGALCDAAARCGRKTNALQTVPALHKILCGVALIFALCGAPILIYLDPVNLFYAFFDALYGVALFIALFKISGLALVVASNLLVPNLWCRRLCPLGGLQDWLNDAKRLLMNQKTAAFDKKRRLVFGGALAAGSAFAL